MNFPDALVLSLVVAVAGAAVTVGMYLQKVTTLTLEVAKLDTQVRELRRAQDKTTHRQGKRIGEIERWVAAQGAVSDGRAPALPPRHETRGVPLVLSHEESDGDGDGGDDGS